MTRAVLELNDQGLMIQAEAGPVLSEIGFASLTPQGIICGEAARATAWLHPQLSYSQYWRQLNQLPLPIKSPWARHNADIAFAQLKQLHQEAAQPDSVIVAVPACFNEQQLSLLLGLLAALPVEVEALIDSGLASCLHMPGDTLLVDLQLQQAVLSVCRRSEGELQLSAQQVIPDLGLVTLYNAVAQHISRRLIEDARYDPLHSSDGEQYIYNHLPGWLSQLTTLSELSITIPSPQGELSLLLDKKVLASLLVDRWVHLTTKVEQQLVTFPGVRLCFTDRSSLLPAFIHELADADVAAPEQVLSNCFHHSADIIQQSEPLHLLTSLPVTSQPALIEKPAANSQVSHLLYQHRAWSLRQPVSIRNQGGVLELSRVIDNQADLVLVLDQQQLTVLHRQDSVELVLPTQTHGGAIVKIGHHQLQLIEVSDG